MKTLIRLATAVCIFAGGACVENLPQDLPDLDAPYYRCNVQPMVDAKCSMLACHGDVRRPYHSFTRNRMRLVGSNVQRNLPLSDKELQLNMTNALGFVDPDLPSESWLLLKPLDSDVGGYYHRGKEIYLGGDVFLTMEEDDYQVLLTWVNGGQAEPDCIYPGSGDGL